MASRATGTQAFLHLFSYPVSLQREHLVKKELDLSPIWSYVRTRTWLMYIGARVKEDNDDGKKN